MKALIHIVLTGLIALFTVFCLTAFASDRFQDNGDGTITDSQLKVMWMKHDNQGDISWLDGLRWVRYNVAYQLPDNKYGNWRLPTIKELKSLYMGNVNSAVETDCGMKVRIVSAITLSCGWIWASDSKKSSAVVFTFKEGYQFSDLKMNKTAHRVLAVRDLE